MQATISLRAPAIGAAPDLAVDFVRSVAALAKVGREDAEALRTATERLVHFTLEHAYLDGATGDLAVEAHLFDGGIRLDVHDWGLPLELERTRAETGGHEASALEVPGLDLAGLVDEASFHNLGRDGKLFSVVKHCVHDSPVSASAPLLSEHDDHETTAPAPEDLHVRTFEPGDEEGICQLVYRNYKNTYGSEFFYIPEKLLERNRDGEVVSSIAVAGGQIVGHHALLRKEGTQVAETGAAVIHPDYKGLGIFNRLSEHTLTTARQLRLPAVYGHAVTLHPYSQKAEHTHGYRETALAVGRARASIRLEGNKLTRTGNRHGIVVSYLCFQHPTRPVVLPETYRDPVLAAYTRLGLEVEEGKSPEHGGAGITAHLDAGLNVGTIAIPAWAPGDEAAVHRAFHYLLAKHCDMVYAEIDLERVAEIDAVVELLNREGFFYSGIAPLGRDGHDQLVLQYENTLDVEEDEIVCYSDGAQELKAFVLADKARVTA
jgi:anti-sigma regulatory factor (Ser/Thr protein kinase)/GNAT superfamily N-acetyltransferase